MPLAIPVLDDRRFQDLVEEARALIPTYAPGWTNHNPSDPGITLIELFAHLAESLIYRLDQVPPESICAFLKLLDGVDRKPETPGELDSEVRASVRALRKPDRAVTAQDYEHLVLEALKPGWRTPATRLRCFPGLDLRTDPPVQRPDHVSVAIVLGDVQGSPSFTEVEQAVAAFIEPRRMLGTQFHLASPLRVPAAVTITVLPDTQAVREAVRSAVSVFLSTASGGEDGKGWPLGHSVFASELYAFVGALPGVTEVRSVALASGKPGRASQDTLARIRLEPYEVVDASVTVTAPATA